MASGPELSRNESLAMSRTQTSLNREFSAPTISRLPRLLHKCEKLCVSFEVLYKLNFFRYAIRS